MSGGRRFGGKARELVDARVLRRVRDQRDEARARAESLATENERLKARIELQTDTILAYQRYTGIVDVEELREACDEEGGT